MIDIREKPQRVERALLLGICFDQDAELETRSLLEELAELVGNLHIGVVDTYLARAREPKPRLLLGEGKARQVIAHAKRLNCDCIVVDGELAPAQQRNWEKEAGITVIDRAEVILDIFAERAQTKEATLQVELARLQYELPRLRRAWTHLSRQRGGGVTQRGEGEAQIELDQRMIRTRIARLRRELDEVRQRRGVQRKQRLRVPLPTAAIVGYTNAGKSSLLNALTRADVLEADKLFATLDPTTRQLALPSGQKILLTDTVGFVRKLPHGLVEAFKATLEEALVADILIHVVDASSPEAEQHCTTTEEVLKELGAEEKPRVIVLNKVDALDPAANTFDIRSFAAESVVRTSARTGEGLPELQNRLEALLADRVEAVELLIPHDRYDLLHQLHRAGCVKRERALPEGTLVHANVPPRQAAQVEAYRLAAEDSPAHWHAAGEDVAASEPLRDAQ